MNKLLVSAIALAAALSLSSPSIAQFDVLGGGASVDVDLGGGGADVDVNVGGGGGLDADANVDLGSGVDASVDVGLGGGGGLNVDTDVGLGSGGLDVDADIGLGGTGLDVDVGLGGGGGLLDTDIGLDANVGLDVDLGGPGSDGRGGNGGNGGAGGSGGRNSVVVNNLSGGGTGLRGSGGGGGAGMMSGGARCSAADDRAGVALVTGTRYTNSSQEEWRNARSVQIVPLRFCPQVRAQITSTLANSGLSTWLRTAISRNDMIDGQLRRNNIDASQVIAIGTQGGTLKVFVY